MKLPKNKRRALHGRLKLLVYSQAKLGKTTFVCGFPDVLLVRCERGYLDQNVYQVDVRCWDDFRKLSEKLLEKRKKYKFIAIDTADALIRMCEDEVCEGLKIQHMSDMGHGKGWALVRTQLNRYISRLMDCGHYGIIFLSHLRTQEVLGKSRAKLIPNLSGQGKSIIQDNVDAVGVIRARTIKKGGKYVKQRVLDFGVSEFNENGDRYGVFDKPITLFKDPEKSYRNFMKLYVKKEKDNG